MRSNNLKVVPVCTNGWLSILDDSFCSIIIRRFPNHGRGTTIFSGCVVTWNFVQL